ncbi:hypothetical protein FPQ18DRAFT_135313 [Pyronema domesticum]|nr:hypothetical protein FPQ18DRAFT_135313 [Pyronema domesticum]
MNTGFRITVAGSCFLFRNTRCALLQISMDHGTSSLTQEQPQTSIMQPHKYHLNALRCKIIKNLSRVRPLTS